MEIVILVPLILFGFSIFVRRLHDFGWSGWAILTIFFPIVNIICTIYAIFRKGDAMANRFGEKPAERLRFQDLLVLTR